MKKYLLIYIIVLINNSLFSQSESFENCEPIGGKVMLAIHFADLKFTADNLEKLEMQNFIELVFDVDKEGNATFNNVKGTQVKHIETQIIEHCKQLPKFYPKTINGKAVASNYYFVLDYFNDIKASKYNHQKRNKANSDLLKVD